MADDEPEIVVVPDLEALAAEAAERIATALAESVEARGRADWATTGGSTVPAIYRRLAGRAAAGHRSLGQRACLVGRRPVRAGRPPAVQRQAIRRHPPGDRGPGGRPARRGDPRRLQADTGAPADREPASLPDLGRDRRRAWRRVVRRRACRRAARGRAGTSRRLAGLRPHRRRDRRRRSPAFGLSWFAGARIAGTSHWRFLRLRTSSRTSRE